MKAPVLISVLVLTTVCVYSTPRLQAAPCEGYKEAYKLARDGVEVVAVGKGFCIVRYGDGAG